MWLWVSQLGEEGGVLEIGWAHCGVVLWQIENVYHGIVIVNVCKEKFAVQVQPCLICTVAT